MTEEELKAAADALAAREAALAAKEAEIKAAAEAAEKAAVEAAEKAAAEKAAADGDKLTPEAAALLKEVMEKKEKLKEANEKLKAYDGVDPAEYAALKAEKANAEKARAEAAGDFERVKAMMADEHKKETEKKQAAITEKESLISQQQKMINDLTIGQSFSNSKFVTEELVLTPAKARTIYGSHFEFEGEKIVAYDKPKGSTERTKLVDSSGVPLGFEESVRKLVEADPEKEKLLKSTLKTGAGSETIDTKTESKPGDKVSGVSIIAAALASRKAK
jgi:hypothetical protein